MQIIPTSGPNVCKYHLHWAIWIPRDVQESRHATAKGGEQPVLLPELCFLSSVSSPLRQATISCTFGGCPKFRLPSWESSPYPGKQPFGAAGFRIFEELGLILTCFGPYRDSG